MKKTEFYKVKAADKYLLEVKLDYPENPKSVVILCREAVQILMITIEKLVTLSLITLICFQTNCTKEI